MCGRMNITDNEGILLLMEMIGMPSWTSIQQRYNVAPSAMLDVAVAGASAEGDGAVEAQQQQMRWGLIPPWAKEGQFKRPLINARSETVREKPSFRHLVSGNRALVPITGFYEWLREGNSRRPFYIMPANDQAMLLAGLYQQNRDGQNEVTLLTTDANDTMARVHHRMPVIIRPEDAGAWLSTGSDEQIDLLMKPAANNMLSMYEVGAYVSNARNEGEMCITPVATQG